MRFLFALIAAALLFPLTGYAQDAAAGAELFKRKCKGCHRLSDGKKMGPGLAGVTDRRSEEWIDNWLKGPKDVIESGDEYAVSLLEKYKKKMPTLKAMQDPQNRKDIISFLKQNDGK